MKRKFLLIFCMIYVSTFATQDIPNNLADSLFESAVSNAQNLVNTNNTELSKQETNLLFISEAPLQDEYALTLKEFRDIVRLYNRLPSAQYEKIELLRALLKRLENMSPKTDFLKGQKAILEAAILYRLNIRGTAATKLTNIAQNSPYLSIREKSAKIFLFYSLLNNDMLTIKKFSQEFETYLSSELNAFFSIMMKEKNDITAEDASIILNHIILSPVSAFYPEDTPARILEKIQHKIDINELDLAINNLIHDQNTSLVLALIKMRLRIQDVSNEQLTIWSSLLGDSESELIKILRIVDSQKYQEYLSFYYKRANALSRGRTYNVKLYNYRGERKAPYNLAKAEQAFKEYLNGNIEEKYALINTEYAFRNFLAFKRYDKIAEYASLIQEKLWTTIPYINFWQSYAMLQEGQTNGVIRLLGDALVETPEEYYGLLSKNLLKSLFKKIPFSKSSYLSSMKEQSSENYLNRLRYAHALYYLGNFAERNQAEKIYKNIGMISTPSRNKISNKKKPLFAAYLELGLHKEANLLSYRDGIVNPYTRDVLLGEYLLENNQMMEYNTIISRRSLVIHNTLSFMIPKDSLQLYYPMLYQESVKAAREKIREKSNTHVDIYLLYSLMRAESFYKPRALSKAGARGLMQIMPKTGKWLSQKYFGNNYPFSVSNLYEPELNIYFGTSYLYENIDRFGIIPALAAYNSGPNFVNSLIKKYEPNSDLELIEIHPKRETRNYVRKIMEFYQRYKNIYEGQENHILLPLT